MATSAEYDQEQKMQQNQMNIGSLIQASVLGKTALRAQVKKLMACDAHIKHEFGVTVCICDHTYTFLGINLCKIGWQERNCPPLSHALTMFGVIECEPCWTPKDVSGRARFRCRSWIEIA
nr:protein UL38 [synthetic construct]